MNFSKNINITIKNKVKRKIKKKKEAEAKCYHCGGAFKGSGESETCLMCGREKNHLCNNCMHVPQDQSIQALA